MKTIQIQTIVVVAILVFAPLIQGFAQKISTGAGSSYTVTNGTVRDWGLNGQAGRLGFGSTATQYPGVDVPTNVVYLAGGTMVTNVAAVAGGKEHALALLTDGTLVGWGANGSGELGLQVTPGAYATPKSAAVLSATNLTNVKQIEAGYGFSVALLSNGTVFAWGDNVVGNQGGTDVLGKLPSSVTTDKTNVPHQVTNLLDIEKIAVGTTHSLALKSDGTLWAWGHGEYGKLGNDQSGNYYAESNAVQVLDLENVIAMAAAVDHSVAVTSDGKVWAWGRGADGRLGTGNNNDQKRPVRIGSFGDVSGPTVVTNSTGNAQLRDGDCRQDIGYFQITTNYCTNAPIQAVAAGRDYTLALARDGQVWAWGKNDVGQLGDGSIVNRTTPVKVSNAAGDGGYLTNVVAIAAAKHSGSVTWAHSMALLTDGKIMTWGDNYRGQLGVSTNTYPTSALPVQVQINP